MVINDHKVTHPEDIGHADWELDLESGLVVASDEINDFYGLEKGRPHPRLSYTEKYHPDDEARMIEFYSDAVEGHRELIHVVLRAVGSKGVQTISVMVRVIRNPEGKATKLKGYRLPSIDVREDAARETQIGLWSFDLETHAFHGDAEFRRMLVLSPGQGDCFPELESRLHPDDAVRLRQSIPRMADFGIDSVRSEMRVIMPCGMIRHVQIELRIDRDHKGKLHAHGATIFKK